MCLYNMHLQLYTVHVRMSVCAKVSANADHVACTCTLTRLSSPKRVRRKPSFKSSARFREKNVNQQKIYMQH